MTIQLHGFWGSCDLLSSLIRPSPHPIPFRCSNGILYNMHPSEGVWLFKGPLQTNSAMMHYGSGFGSESLQTSFPVASSLVKPNYSWKASTIPNTEVCKRKVGFVRNRDNSAIIRMSIHGEQCQGQYSATPVQNNHVKKT